MNKIKNIILNIIKYIYPYKCITCDKHISDYNDFLCSFCYNKLIVNTNSVCIVCGVELLKYKVASYNNKCCNCNKNPPYFDKSNSYFIYNDFISTIITDFKYKDNTNLKNFLGEIILKTYKNAKFLEEVDIIIPLPISYIRLIQRKYNQTCLLAIYLSKKLQIQYSLNILLKSRHTKNQASLGLSERLENIKGSFKINNKKSKLIKNKNVLLIDDVITTGNTVNEASRILKQSGVKNIFIISLARVEGILKIYYT